MPIPTLRTDPAIAQLGTLFFLVLGIGTLVFPYKFQALALKKCQKFWGFPNPFLPFAETKAYIWMLRILGAVFIAAALLLEFALIARHRS